MNFIKFTWLIFFAASNSLASTEIARPSPLFIIISGYWSCGKQGTSTDGMNLSSQFLNFLDESKQDFSDSRWLKICLRGTFWDAKNFGQNLILSSSLGLKNIELPSPKLRRYHPIVESKDSLVKALVFRDGLPKDEIKPWVRPIVKQIKEDSENGIRPIVIIGHSFGAWVGMQVSSLLIDEGIPIKALYTLDAISRLECPPNLMILSYVGIPLIYPAQPDGRCTRFPADISLSMQKKLRDSIVNWTNIYQDQFEFLHSGPAEDSGSEQQHFDNFTSEELDKSLSGGHSAIAESDEAWRLIRNSIRELL